MTVATMDELKLSRLNSTATVRWSIFAMVTLVMLSILLAHDGWLDTYLWRATRWAFGSQERYNWNTYRVAPEAATPDTPWYRTHTPPLGGQLYKKTEHFWITVRSFGDTYVTLFFIIIMWVYDARRWKASAMIVIVTLATGLFSTLVRMCCGRLRPNGTIPWLESGLRNDGENYWIWFRGFQTTQDLSFPSGHATLAFATAAVLAYLSPKTTWFWFILATLCAFSRVVMHAHFYTDIIMGAAIGWGLGFLCCHWTEKALARFPVKK